MVAAGDDVHAGGKDFRGRLGRDAGAAGGVFAIGDDEIGRMLAAHPWQEFLHRPTPRFTNNVPDEKNLHGFKVRGESQAGKKRNRRQAALKTGAQSSAPRARFVIRAKPFFPLARDCVMLF